MQRANEIVNSKAELRMKRHKAKRQTRQPSKAEELKQRASQT
jgi:hypothetical protein